MANPFFEAIMGNNSRGSIPSKEVLVQMAQQFKRNPLGFLLYLFSCLRDGIAMGFHLLCVRFQI